MKKIKILIVVLAGLLIVYGGYVFAGGAKTGTWNAAYEAIPADGDNVSEGATRIRNFKRDIRERMAEDHYVDVAGTQADHGEHVKVTFQAPLGEDPTAVANKGFLYTKDISTKAELFWRDEDGHVTQITSGGQIYKEEFPAGTKMVFYQDACPAGWTIQDSLNDKVLLITKGSTAGGQTGGAEHTTGTWTQPDHTLITAEMPAHTHQKNTHTASGGGSISSSVWAGYMGDTTPNAYNTGSTGGGGAHNHGTTWRPAAYNVIMCLKD